MGIEHLKRKFEDGEADIISEIYSTHFRARLEDGMPNIGQEDIESASATSPNPLLNFEKRNNMLEYDSIEENESGMKTNFGPAPDVATYSKPLKDQIKYVQYIPKNAKGTLEDAVNQLYMDDEVRKDFEARIAGDAKI